MTTATSLLDGLKQSVDSVMTTRTLLDRFDNSRTKELTTESYQFLRELINLQQKTQATKLTVSPEQFKVQQELSNSETRAHKKKAIDVSLVLAQDFIEFSSEYTDKIHKAKMALELAYRVNNIIQLPDQLLEVLQLKDVAPAKQVNRKLMTLQLIVSQLVDIKSILHDPVDSDDPGNTLFGIQQLLKNEKSLHAASHFYHTQLHPHFGIEHCRSQLSEASAKDSDYNAINCIELFTNLCSLTANVDKLQYHWFLEKPRYSNDPVRLFQSISQLADLTSDRDTVNPATATAVRLNRIYKTMDLITHVIYPCILTELTNLEQVYSDLGKYKYLDKDAKKATRRSYAVEGQFDQDGAYLSFLYTGASSPSDYLTDSMIYCHGRLDKTIQAATIRKDSLADVTDMPRSISTTMKVYPAEILSAYLELWGSKYHAWSEYFQSLMSTTTPLVSWSSLEVDTAQWPQLDNEDDSNLHLVRISQLANLTTPYQYVSPYRTGRESLTSIKTTALGYQDLNRQLLLKTSTAKLVDQLTVLKFQFESFQTTLSCFNSDLVPPLQINRCNAVVSNLLQQLTYTSHDLEIMASAYAR